jgi:hypothetical protein
VDFAGPQNIGEVDVFTMQDNYSAPAAPTLTTTFALFGITDFQVQYLSGQQWVTVPGGAITGTNRVWNQITFPPVTTSAIRVLVLGSRDGFSRITEVEAYASSGGGLPAPGPFGKTAPSAGATSVALTPTLSWAASAGATGYDICLETSINGACDSGWTAATGTSVVTSALAGGTTYEWQVRAQNTTGTTEADGGSWRTFTTVQSGAPINVAAAVNGGVATASSFYSAAYGPQGAIDGDRKGLNWGNGGGWNDATPGTFGDWLRVDFAGPQNIGEVDVFTMQDNYSAPVAPTLTTTFTVFGITDFQVQYLSGQQWVTVPGGAITGTNRVWNRITFPPVTTSAIRVLVAGSRDGFSRITEVEAYTAGP